MSIRQTLGSIATAPYRAADAVSLWIPDCLVSTDSLKPKAPLIEKGFMESSASRSGEFIGSALGAISGLAQGFIRSKEVAKYSLPLLFTTSVSLYLSNYSERIPFPIAFVLSGLVFCYRLAPLFQRTVQRLTGTKLNTLPSLARSLISGFRTGAIRGAKTGGEKFEKAYTCLRDLGDYLGEKTGNRIHTRAKHVFSPIFKIALVGSTLIGIDILSRKLIGSGYPIKSLGLVEASLASMALQTLKTLPAKAFFNHFENRVIKLSQSLFNKAITLYVCKLLSENRFGYGLSSLVMKTARVSAQEIYSVLKGAYSLLEIDAEKILEEQGYNFASGLQNTIQENPIQSVIAVNIFLAALLLYSAYGIAQQRKHEAELAMNP